MVKVRVAKQCACSRKFPNSDIMQKALKLFSDHRNVIDKYSDALPSIKYTPPKSDLRGSRKFFCNLSYDKECGIVI